eukprot:ANDGO_00620.mRNA.1 hypothetical protein
MTAHFAMYWFASLPWVMKALSFFWSVLSLCLLIIDFGRRLRGSLKCFEKNFEFPPELKIEWHIMSNTADRLSRTWSPLTCLTFLAVFVILLFNLISILKSNADIFINLGLSFLIAGGMIGALFVLAMPHAIATRVFENVVNANDLKFIVQDEKKLTQKKHDKALKKRQDPLLEEIRSFAQNHPISLSLAGYSMTLRKVASILIGTLTLLISILALQGVKV